MALSQAELDKLNADRAVAYNSGQVPATRNKVSISIDPTTRKINITAPEWYTKTKEFNDQILPSFKALVGKNVSDNQFKALMDAGMQTDIQSQVDALQPRQAAIDQYRAKYAKASDDDAMTYYRNVAAAQNADGDGNTQVVLNYDKDGNAVTRSVKDALSNFNSHDDKTKGAMIAQTDKELADPNISEKDRAAIMGLRDFFQTKGAFKADGVTVANEGLKSFLANSESGLVGTFLNTGSRGVNAIQGKGWQSIAEQNTNDLKNDAPLGNLEGVDQAKDAGKIGADVFNTGADIISTLPLGGEAVWAKAPQLLKGINAIEDTGRIGKVVGGTIKSLPADVAYSGAATINNPNVDGLKTFGENVVGNLATLGAAKLVGRGLSEIDTRSGGLLTDANNLVSQQLYKGKKFAQAIPVAGNIMKKFTEKFVDADAPIKRIADDAFATAKGNEARAAAKQNIFTVNTILRQASQQGQPEAAAFRKDSQSWSDAIAERNKLQGPEAVKSANDYVVKSTLLSRAEAGQIPNIKDEELESLRQQVAELATPENQAYRQHIANFTNQVTELGTKEGILDKDIVAFMQDPENKNFADQYIQLQQDITSTKNPYTGKGSSKNLKNTTPVKRIKGGIDADFGDPLLIADQRMEVMQKMISQNKIANLFRDAVGSGQMQGEIISDARNVKKLSDLKLAVDVEKTAVKNALDGELTSFNTDISGLVDDLEDFAGAGKNIVSNRIDQSVDNMVNNILNDPKLQEEVTKLADKLGDGKEGVEQTAALGILFRHKQDVLDQIDATLSKAEVTPGEKKELLQQFKQNITDKFDDSIVSQGKGVRTGARELNERANEIRNLRKSIAGTQETQASNVIAYYENGAKGHIRLDDPDLAAYFTQRQAPATNGIFTQFMTESSRFFRLGTTGLDPVFGLLVNPIRDVPQGTLLTGLKTFAPNQLNKDLMMAHGGLSEADATAELARLQQVKETNIGNNSFNRVARGDNVVVNNKKQYDQFVAEDRDNSRGKSKYIINALFPNRALKNAEDIFSNVEYATRSRVFDSSYAAAIKRGVSPKDAENEALFYAAEVTTNFLNAGSQTKNLLRTIPYLSAAINGTASFTRLWALDPIGVSGRFLAGVAMPVTYLTAQNLSTPEKIQGYTQIPEYTKRTNVIIMLNGDNYVKIPLSYQIAAVLNPFREAVETHYDVDPQSFQQIFVKGLLSSGPIDLSGFATTDYAGNVNTGLAAQQTISGLLPQAVRPIIEGATGKSMYTGGTLNPTDEQIISQDGTADDGSIRNSDRTYSTRNSKTLGGIADFLGVPQGTIQNYFSSYTGTVGAYLLNATDKLLGAPSTAQGGKDIQDNAQKRFLGSTANGQSTADYYGMIESLTNEKKLLVQKLDTLSRRSTDDATTNDKRQQLIDDFGQKVASAADKYGEYYNRVGGFKPYQADALVNLLNLGPNQGTFAEGSYQQDDLNTARSDAREDAQRRASDLGLPGTATRDIYGKTTRSDTGALDTSFDYTTLPNSLIRTRTYNAPKQIIYEAQEIMKGNKKKGVKSLYDEKKPYDDKITELYKQAKGLTGKDASAIYDQISDVEESYMKEVFDQRIKPLIDKYGVEILRNTKIADEVTKYVVVPGDFTPFASKKKQPYQTDDVFAFLKDRYGVGSINQANLKNDAQAEKYLKLINASISSGKTARANYQLSNLQQNINEGKIYVNDDTMKSIADTIKARNKRR